MAALSQFHGVRPARQLWKPRPRRVPERAALALRGREGVSAETRPPPGGRPAGRRGRRGRGPGRPSAPEPGSPPATQRLAELRGAEGGVFPEWGCREGTGDPRSWSGESTAQRKGAGETGRAGAGRGGVGGSGAGSGRRGSGEERLRSRREPGVRGGKGRAERTAGARRAGHSPGEPGRRRRGRSCGPSHPLPGGGKEGAWNVRNEGWYEMRAAEEGAGGSGGPGPSGWSLGRRPAGAGAGRERGGGRGADGPGTPTPNFDLGFWIRPPPLPAHQRSL